MVILSYVDRKGAGVGISIRTEEELCRRIKTLRMFAVVRNEQGEIVGGIEKTDGQDDRRIRWNWWYCKDGVRAALKA